MKKFFVSCFAFTALFASPALAQFAHFNEMPSEITRGAAVFNRPEGTLIIPRSSLSQGPEAGNIAHTNTRMFVPTGLARTNGPGPDATGKPPYSGYIYNTPATLNCIYYLGGNGNGCKPDTFVTNATGGSKVIVIVDAYHYPHALTDLTKYSKQFGLPAPTSSNFQQVNLAGNTTNDGWGSEAALDIQMAHAMAPSAKIILVEAKSNNNSDLDAAIVKANSLITNGGEVSMSWGSDEYSSEASDFTHFTKSKVVYFASTGDTISPSAPAVLQNVVAVGGTSIIRDGSKNFTGETSWTDAGSGYSSYILRPSFQPVSVGTYRGIPDISAVADPNTGVWVYFTGARQFNGGWYIFGGTSVASPLMAAIVNNSNHFLASSAAENAFIYNLKTTSASNYRISVSGTCGPSGIYSTSSDWNPCTGVGSPMSKATQ